MKYRMEKRAAQREKQYMNVARMPPEFEELFEVFEVPGATYAVFATERGRYPTLEQADLRRRAVSEWLPVEAEN